MRTRLSAVLAAGLLAATTATLAPSAAAAPSDQGVASRSTTAAERQAALDYWTPERMRKALPGERRISPLAKPSGQGKPGGGGGGGGSGTLSGVVSVAGATSKGTDVVGKVFFTLKRTNYVCSASSVPSTHGNLVLTAGHCLHQGRGGSRGFASNFVFVPAYAGNGSTQVGPYGTWASSKLTTTSQWANSGDFVYDVGFAVMADGGASNSSVAAAVGTQGITFGRGAGLTTTSYGYPAASPYDGTKLGRCDGTTFADVNMGGATQGLVCGMTGGSSGGPWYHDTGSGVYAHSVNSYKYTNDTTRMYGPFFGSAIYSLYSSVD
ncbi:MAG: trypsin-like serine peptidase [Actinomycetes bacterium]